MYGLIQDKQSGDVFVVSPDRTRITDALHYTEYRVADGLEVDTARVEAAAWACENETAADFAEDAYQWLHEWK